MTLPLLAALAQLADGLAYQLAVGYGIEANPVMAAIGDPGLLLAVKVVGAIVIGAGSLVLVMGFGSWTRWLVGWLAVVGFVGCLSELTVISPL